MAAPSGFTRPTAARIASASDPACATSASPSASSVTLRYDVRITATRTVFLVASIPSSLDMILSLLHAPVHDGARRVGVQHLQHDVGRGLARRLVVGRVLRRL